MLLQMAKDFVSEGLNLLDDRFRVSPDEAPEPENDDDDEEEWIEPLDITELVDDMLRGMTHLCDANEDLQARNGALLTWNVALTGLLVLIALTWGLLQTAH